MPGTRSASVRSRRAAHWVHTVRVPPTITASRSTCSSTEWGSENCSARPGTAIHADSPVSQRLTWAPLVRAVVATVNAWDSFSGDSIPAVSLMISWRDWGMGQGYDQARGIRTRRQSSAHSGPTRVVGRSLGGLRGGGLSDHRVGPFRPGDHLLARRSALP